MKLILYDKALMKLEHMKHYYDPFAIVAVHDTYLRIIVPNFNTLSCYLLYGT